jgi:serine/threonine protein kinase
MVQDETSAQNTIKKEVDILKKINNPFVVNYYGCAIGKMTPPSSSNSPSPSSSPSSTSQPSTKETKPSFLSSITNLTLKDKGKKSKSFSAIQEDTGPQPLWILMDYCSGGSIRDYMDTTGKTLTEQETSCILVGVLQGLAYLHSQNIIHRDLKAANILINQDGQVKIADFGISTQLNATITGNAKTMVGTTYWMAPEILEEKYTYKIDLWSVGITTIEMLENHPPHWDIKPFQLILKLPKEPSPTFKQPEKFSSQANNFIKECLIKNPIKRPDSKMLIQHPFILETINKGTQYMSDVVIKMVKEKIEFKK